MNIFLTNEQAEFLHGVLDEIAGKISWSKDPNANRARLEHAETIRRKIEEELKRDKW